MSNFFYVIGEDRSQVLFHYLINSVIQATALRLQGSGELYVLLDFRV